MLRIPALKTNEEPLYWGALHLYGLFFQFRTAI